MTAERGDTLDLLEVLAAEIEKIESELRAARELRRKLVRIAAAHGRTNREIATVAGCSHTAVQNMLIGDN